MAFPHLRHFTLGMPTTNVELPTHSIRSDPPGVPEPMRGAAGPSCTMYVQPPETGNIWGYSLQIIYWECIIYGDTSVVVVDIKHIYSLKLHDLWQIYHDISICFYRLKANLSAWIQNFTNNNRECHGKLIISNQLQWE